MLGIIDLFTSYDKLCLIDYFYLMSYSTKI